MKNYVGAIALAVTAAALVACGGGGGGGSSSIPSPVQPTATPTSVPTSTSGSVTFGQATSAPLPASVGASGSVSLPAGSGTATITGSTTVPSPGPVAIQAQPAASSGNRALIYVTLTASTAVTINGIPGFTATLPTGSPTGQYFVAYYATSTASPRPQAPAWVSTAQTGVTGSAGSQITIPATASPTITLAAGQSLFLAVYVGGYIPPININGCVGVNASRSGFAATSAGNVHPITSGDTYTYTGTMTQTFVRSQPCPQPTSTSTATVAVTVALATPGGVTQQTTTETDAFTNYTAKTQTVANVSSSGGAFFESGETTTDGNGNTVVTTYGTPLQYAKVPEAQGNTWSGVLPTTVLQNLADGTTISRNYTTGISGVQYQETATFPGGNGTNVINVNSNASGYYDIAHGTSNELIVKLGPPTAGTIGVALQVGSTNIGTLTIPSWIPASAATSLYSDTTTDLGSGTLPTGCASPVTPTPAFEHLQRAITSVDPVLGYVETETIDSYDFNGSTGWVGPACAVLSDTLAQYYDYSLTTTFGLYFALNAQPVQTTSLTQTISLQPGFTAQGHAMGSAASNGALLARLSGIHFMRAMQRAAIERTAVAALRAYHGGF